MAKKNTTKKNSAAKGTKKVEDLNVSNMMDELKDLALMSKEEVKEKFPTVVKVETPEIPDEVFVPLSQVSPSDAETLTYEDLEKVVTAASTEDFTDEVSYTLVEKEDGEPEVVVEKVTEETKEDVTSAKPKDEKPKKRMTYQDMFGTFFASYGYNI